VLVGLYEEPERPAAAVDYVKKYLGAPVGVDVDALKAENERLRSEVASLHQQLEAAQKTIAGLSTGGK
jgi:predicted ATP-grasp superfamily ATP-dependent carboligase